MKILKRLAACAVALSMTACTAFGTFAVSAEETLKQVPHLRPSLPVWLSRILFLHLT